MLILGTAFPDWIMVNMCQYSPHPLFPSLPFPHPPTPSPSHSLVCNRVTFSLMSIVGFYNLLLFLSRVSLSLLFSLFVSYIFVILFILFCLYYPLMFFFLSFFLSFFHVFLVFCVVFFLLRVFLILSFSSVVLFIFCRYPVILLFVLVFTYPVSSFPAFTTQFLHHLHHF